MPRIRKPETPEQKVARIERQRLRRAENPERERAYCAKYRAENPEKIRAKSAKWRAENRDYEAKYRAEHPQKIRERQIKWIAANPSKRRETVVRELLHIPAALKDHIPPELIQAKIMQLQIRRELKQMKKENAA